MAAVIDQRSQRHGDALVDWLVVADQAAGDQVLDNLAKAAPAEPVALDVLIAAVYRCRFTRAAIRLVVFGDDDVDEALQNTALNVATSIDNWNGDGSVRSWISTIARRQAVAVLRHRRPDTTQPAADLEPILATERFSSRLADRHDVHDVLLSLPPAFAQVIRLRDIEHHSYNEIAKTLDIPINTVRSRLARGRAAAQRSLRTKEDIISQESPPPTGQAQ